MMDIFGNYLRVVVLIAAVAIVATSPGFAAHAIQGPDVKVTDDNENGDFGTPTPSFDAWNLFASTTTVAINPLVANIVAAAAFDFRMAPVFGNGWVSLYVSSDTGGSGSTRWCRAFRRTHLRPARPRHSWGSMWPRRRR